MRITGEWSKQKAARESKAPSVWKQILLGLLIFLGFYSLFGLLSLLTLTQT